MKIGFIGLGKLGTAIAKNLSENGITPVVYNRTIEKSRKSGFEYVNTAKELTYKDVDFIIINVYDSTAVNDILNNPDGLLSGDLKDKTVIDTTTNHFDDVLNFHRLVKNAGGSYLEAPAVGSVVPAEKGQLMMLVSGNKDIFEKSKNILDIIGGKVFHFTEKGKATKMKLINNMVMGGILTVITEAVALAEKSGFSKDEALDLLGAGAGDSKMLNAKKAKIANGDYSPHFDIKTLVKDLNYAQSLAYNVNQQSLIGSLVKELYTMAGNKSSFKDDFAAIYKVFG